MQHSSLPRLASWEIRSVEELVPPCSIAPFPGLRLGKSEVLIIVTDNFCIALFSGVPKLTALYNILQHFLSFTNIIHIIMTTNNV